jgi:hypothetical protein
LKNDQRKEIKKREYLTYTRRNKASTPTSYPDTPPSSIEKVVPPPPPLVHELLPKPIITQSVLSQSPSKVNAILA